eukprot:GSMAST32.ASY1.ANO1.559.1 assembled CDS
MLRFIRFWIEDRGQMSLGEKINAARSLLTPEYVWHWRKKKGGGMTKSGPGDKFIGEVYFLGKSISVTSEEEFNDFKDMFSSLIWLTYRRDFPRIVPTDYTSDSGWGCMLRTGQMLLALAFQRHFFGTNWRVGNIRGNPRQYQKYYDILTWFNDTPNQRCFYSIHKMVQEGNHLGKRAGQWYGPTIVSHIIQRCALTHRVGGQGPLGVYVADDSVIYTDEVVEICRKRGKCEYDENKDIAWGTSALILVPLRLGLNRLNEGYCPCTFFIMNFLQTFFSYEIFLGFIGGRPGHSLYFLGSQNSNLFFLDPHSRTVKKVRQHFSTFHCRTPKVMNMRALDPSMAVGFYCRNKSDLDELTKSLNDVAENFPMPVVTTAKKRREMYSEHSTPKMAKSFLEDTIELKEASCKGDRSWDGSGTWAVGLAEATARTASSGIKKKLPPHLQKTKQRSSSGSSEWEML